MKNNQTRHALFPVAAVAACAAAGLVMTTAEPSGAGTAVGLAIEIDNGVAMPLPVKSGQTFYLNQIDLRASATSTIDEGVAGLSRRGDFANLAWSGTAPEEQEFVLLANSDGTFTRRRFFRGARWMNARSTFRLSQLNQKGGMIGRPITLDAGLDNQRRDGDDFFIRRFRSIQWTRDCRTEADCTGASAFEEEALVELRNAMHPNQTFTIDPRTAVLSLDWSARPGAPYRIPVTQVASPAYDYGFSIEIDILTPSDSDGSYPAGCDITFRITLRDGAGKRLHPDGALPSYNEVIFGPNSAGIQYYRAFFDPTATYWRRKHRERMLMAEFLGPAQSAQPIRSVIDLDKFLNAEDVQVTGLLARDGVYAAFHTFPAASKLFGGAFDPGHTAWKDPVPDTWTHTIPADALPGTYYLNVKGRRVYLGEDIPFSKTIEVQVGTAQRTQPELKTGNCDGCHRGPSSLATINHANANRGTCAGCHVPLGFEFEGPIYVRTHFIHSRSHRFGAPPDRCAACHLTRAGIQRTSKSACQSCHTSYPKSHTASFGPAGSIYVGGGRESFRQCTSACHTTHPNDGFGSSN